MPLRPLSVGEILDGAFRAFRTNPRTMLAFAAVVSAVVALIRLLPMAYYLASLTSFSETLAQPPAGEAPDLSTFAPMLRAMVALSAAALLTAPATTVLTALLVVAVAEATLGRRLSAAALWRRVRPRLGAVIGLALLIFLATSLLPMLLVGGLAALVWSLDGPASAAIMALILTPLVVPVLVYVTMRWSLSAPALLLENVGVTTALRRSWRLSQGSWWRLFGIQLLSGLIVSFGTSIVAYPASLLGNVAMGLLDGWPGALVGAVLVAIGEIAANSVFIPFAAAVVSLLYIDRRMRVEGLDVELARAAGAGQPG